MEINKNLTGGIRFYYRIEKITHRPVDEDKITIIKEVKEQDLILSRILATTAYEEEKHMMEGSYSPKNFKSYDTRKGIGFNLNLLMVDLVEDNIYIVESTMQDIQPPVKAQKKEEQEIFSSLGLQWPL